MNVVEELFKLFTIEFVFLFLAGLCGLWIFADLLARGVRPSELVIGDDGKLSWTRVGAVVGGTTFTYGFLHMVSQNTLTEWFFNGYGLIMFGTAFAYKANILKGGQTREHPIESDGKS